MGDLATGRSADHRAALPGPGRLGKPLRRVEASVGMGGLPYARPEPLPSDGADHCPDLQLVDRFYAAGHPRPTRRGDYLASAGAAWDRAPDAAQQPNQSGGHQYPFQGSGDRRSLDQGERVPEANQGDCGAVDSSGPVAADPQCRLSVFSPRQGAWEHWPARRGYRLTAVFRMNAATASRFAFLAQFAKTLGRDLEASAVVATRGF